jgi:hypothetical protein
MGKMGKVGFTPYVNFICAGISSFNPAKLNGMAVIF